MYKEKHINKDFERLYLDYQPEINKSMMSPVFYNTLDLNHLDNIDNNAPYQFRLEYGYKSETVFVPVYNKNDLENCFRMYFS